MTTDITTQELSTDQDDLFVFFVKKGLTQEQLHKNIKAHPTLWGQYKSWLTRLPKQKYRLTENKATIRCPISSHPIALRQIQALYDFQTGEGNTVNKGDLGGFVAHEFNLSHSGKSWVANDAKVFGNARVVGDACVRDSALIYGSAIVSDFALVAGKASMSDNAVLCDRAKVLSNAMLYGQCIVQDSAIVTDEVLVGGDAVIEKWARVEGSKLIISGIISEANLYQEQIAFSHRTHN